MPTRIMGVVNLTPDSFSDGGADRSAQVAIERALRMADDGADILDLGGESTRPNATPVSEGEEMDRVLPVLEGLVGRTSAQLSIDTMKPAVARAAMAAGAHIWNDVRALKAEGALEASAKLGCDVVLMHMQGAPQSMQSNPRYDDVVGEVIAFLQTRVAAAVAAGVAHARLSVDPGIGFGKTLAHNLALMRALPRIKAETGAPLVFGASRKRFILGIDPRATDPLDRLGGSLAAALHAARLGADVVRVHDVRATAQALAVQAALLDEAA